MVVPSREELPVTAPEIVQVLTALAAADVGARLGELGIAHPPPKQAARPARREGAADAIALYLHEVEKIPRTTREEELALGRRIAEAEQQVVAALLAAPFMDGPRDDGAEAELDRATARLARWERRLERADAELERELTAGGPRVAARRRHAAARSVIEREARTSADDLRQLAFVVRRGTDEATRAKRELVRAHLRQVVWAARRYQGQGLPLADLIQEGNIGVMTAANKYDYRLGLRFSTYAQWWIRQSMVRALSTQGRAIRLPAHRAETLTQLNQVRRRLAQRLHREPNVAEMAAELNARAEEVEQLLIWAGRLVSLEAPIGEEDGGRLAEIIADPSVELPSATAMAAELDAAAQRQLASLSPREREVLSMRFGLEGDRDMTLEEIGQQWGVTRERVRQLESRALAKLRSPARSRALREFLEGDGQR